MEYEEESYSSHRRYNEESYGGDDNNDPNFTEEDYANPNPNYPQPPYSEHNPGPEPVQYGGMATSDESQQQQQHQGRNDFFLHVDPSVNQEGLSSDFELSNCQGKKRALLIGINYTGTKNELSGCINDVHNIKEFISEKYGFQEEDMVVLTDDQEEEKFIPTRENIIAGMQWLVHDAEANDSFFFHYSGHGGRVKSEDNNEDDGYDETIYPLDFEQYESGTGELRDNDIHDILVRPLPKGCRLTALFDSCHSGTVLDLPFVYSTKGEVKQQNLFKHAGMGLFSAGVAYAQGNKDGALSSIMALGKQLMEIRSAEDSNRKRNTSYADVIMLSGCKDDQTSADANEAGRSTGAMSYALIKSLGENPNPSYQELLNGVREILSEKYDQRPQLSSSHVIDVNLKFQC